MNIVIEKFLLILVVSTYAFGQEHKDIGNITDFPENNQVWLGSVVGDVEVDPEIPIKIEKLGDINWLVENGSQVFEDQIICHTGSEKIRLSERELDLKKTSLANQLLDLDESHEENKKAHARKISDLVKSVSELILTPTERSILGEDFENRLMKDRVLLEKELKNAQIKQKGDYFTRSYEIEKAKLILELDKAEDNHTQLLQSSEYRANSDGTLKILTNRLIKPDTDAGMIVKTGSAEVIVEMLDSRITKIPSNELAVRLLGDDGISYHGNYFETLEEKNYKYIAPLYVFEILKTPDQNKVPNTLRGKRIIEVFRVLEKPGHIVSKSDLLFRFPEEINKDGWSAFIQKRWENVNVDYIGPRELVISKKDEN